MKEMHGAKGGKWPWASMPSLMTTTTTLSLSQARPFQFSGQFHHQACD